MAINNVKELNVRLFFKQFGATDAKLGVNSLIELNELLTKYGNFYQTNDIVWVVSEASFYIITASGGTPTYAKYTGTNGGGDITVYYGGQDAISSFLAGDPAYKPSLQGYSDQDAIIASRTVGTVNRFDIYEASVPGVGNESYVYAGSMLGTAGADGDKGDKGDTGDQGPAMTIDNQGLLSGLLVDCETYPIGYSYLATDTGNLYFKTSELGVLPCTWSAPIPFGKGEAGATTYFVFKRSATQPTTPAIDSLNIPAGWSDYPPTTGDPTQKLWMTKATYSLDSGGNPVGTITWTSPIQLDGDAGLDGTEGRDAGFWVMWSDVESPNRIGLPKPIDHALDLSGQPDWYDDISDTDSPIWMAQIPFDSLTSLWGSWGFSRIAGEEPPYKLNIFRRHTSIPATPTGGLPYKQNDGSFSDGADAVTANPLWTDAPAATGDPLYFSELILYKGATNNAWSTPVRIDGIEGVASGIWTIWSNNAITNKPASPAPVANIISGDGSSLDLSGSPVWYDDVTGIEPNWMASSFYKPLPGGGFAWTAWAVVQIKGENGAVGVPGTDSRSYVPSSMFTRGDDPAIGNNAITALYLLGDNASGYTITGQAPPNNSTPATITINVNGQNYLFSDGIPPIGGSYPENSLKVWQISAVFNSVDHLGFSNKMVWDAPVLMADTGSIDYQYNDGLGDGHSDPGDPGISGTDNGWYNDPKESSYWAAQKNWSEGVTAQWKRYRIRGENGTASKPWYSIFHPGMAGGPVDGNVGDPDTNPEYWQDFLTPITFLNYSVLGQSIMGHYWSIDGGTGNWSPRVDRATELPNVDLGSISIVNNNTLTDVVAPGGVTLTMTELAPYIRPGDYCKISSGTAIVSGQTVGVNDYIYFNPLIVSETSWFPESVGSGGYWSLLATGDNTAPTKPGTPNVIQTTIGVQTLDISWGASTDAVGVTSYKVERMQNDTYWVTKATIYGVGEADPITTYTDTGVTNGNKYAYRITAKDAANNASVSNISSNYVTGALLTFNVKNTSTQSIPCQGTSSDAGTWVPVWSNRPTANDQVGATLYTDSGRTAKLDGSTYWWWSSGWTKYELKIDASGIVTNATTCP